MPPNAVRFPYLPGEMVADDGVLPRLPITISLGKRSINDLALVDSGASVNVLPYTLGVSLGAQWEQQTIRLDLGGNLASVEARGLLVLATVSNFIPVRLVFAWANSDKVPFILGQMNFFQMFDVCFFRAEFSFEVKLRS